MDTVASLDSGRASAQLIEATWKICVRTTLRGNLYTYKHFNYKMFKLGRKCSVFVRSNCHDPQPPLPVRTRGLRGAIYIDDIIFAGDVKQICGTWHKRDFIVLFALWRIQGSAVLVWSTNHVAVNHLTARFLRGAYFPAIRTIYMASPAVEGRIFPNSPTFFGK